MSNDVGLLDDAATFPRASKAAMAGIRYLLDHAKDWAPGGKWQFRGDTPIHIKRLFQVTRSWAQDGEDVVLRYDSRVKALKVTTDHLKRELAYNDANREDQHNQALKVLAIAEQQARAHLVDERKWARKDRISRECVHYQVLFHIFAKLSGKQPGEIPLSATSGPRTHAMNFILAIVSELEDEPPSPRTIWRRIKEKV